MYDTAGPYGDPQAELDVHAGTAKLRAGWIDARGDTATLSGASSGFTQQRLADEGLDHLRFEHLPLPRRALPGKCVTQLHYARAGIVTPEMEFIAIRENMGRERIRGEVLRHQHPGQSWGANLPDNITPEFVRQEVAAGRAIIPANINHPEAEPMIIGRNFGEGERQYRQLGGHVVDRRRGGEAGVVHPLGRGHRDGSLPAAIFTKPASGSCATARCPSAPCRSTGRWRRSTAWRKTSRAMFRDTLLEQAEQGVDYFTIHAGVLLRYVPMTAKRLTGIVSRGGSIMAKWCLSHHQENFLYQHFREICGSAPPTTFRCRSATACAPDRFRTPTTKPSSPSCIRWAS